MSVILEDSQAIDMMERLKDAEKQLRESTKVVVDAERMLDEVTARATAAEHRARVAELRAEELADQNIELKLRLAQYETATQPPAVA